MAGKETTGVESADADLFQGARYALTPYSRHHLDPPIVREFVHFSATHPRLHRIITQECKADSARMDYLVERHVRPLYDRTVGLFERLSRDGAVPPIAPSHLYYILTGAGPTMFVLAPECRRLSGLDPESHEVIDAHADAVCLLLFGR